MKHVNTVVKSCLHKEGKIGCGECNSSCQSACKTSCTVGNQSCAQPEDTLNPKKESK